MNPWDNTRLSVGYARLGCISSDFLISSQSVTLYCAMLSTLKCPHLLALFWCLTLDTNKFFCSSFLFRHTRWLPSLSQTVHVLQITHHEFDRTHLQKTCWHIFPTYLSGNQLLKYINFLHKNWVKIGRLQISGSETVNMANWATRHAISSCNLSLILTIQKPKISQTLN